MVYPGELPRVEDFMGFEKQAYYGLGGMIRSAIGPNIGISNGDFQISATGPASMSVIIGTGSIYAPQAVDASAFGVLGTDSNVIMKQGLLTTPQTLTITAPSTSGFSQYYLVQVGFNEVDGNPVVPPFLNSANPSVPWNGANNLGAALNTTRLDQAVVSLVAGTAAATGSQTIPTPSAGSIPLWVILVSNSTTSITASNWFVSPAAPFFPYLEQITSTFQQVISTNTTYFVNNSTGSDTNGNGLTATTAWATISHAISVLATFNLGGNTVTIQLGLTGVNYQGPNIFSAPSNGITIVRGDPSNQSGYTIAATPSPNAYVIGCQSGTVQLVGVTVTNVAGGAQSGAIGTNGAGSLSLQNITIKTTASGSVALIAASNGSSVVVGAGCIMGGNASAMWFSQFGASITQAASVATASSPAFTTGAAVVTGGGNISVVSGVGAWTGTGASGPKYSATLNGNINSAGGGVNFFPGSTAGSTDGHGVYS